MIRHRAFEVERQRRLEASQPLYDLETARRQRSLSNSQPAATSWLGVTIALAVGVLFGKFVFGPLIAWLWRSL